VRGGRDGDIRDKLKGNNRRLKEEMKVLLRTIEGLIEREKEKNRRGEDKGMMGLMEE